MLAMKICLEKVTAMNSYRQYNQGISVKSQKIKQTVANRASFYRENPHRFAKDYLGLNLKIFQEIILVMIDINTKFMFLAARGLGKTFIIAVYCCIRCILYPGTKICVASKTVKQAKELLGKIVYELMPNSANLRLEIEQSVLNGNDAFITFKNGSRIFIAVASDGARGGRCHILIVDEFRIVKKEIIETILVPFMRNERHPKYLDKPEYSDLHSERNKMVMMSSVWLKSHWAYKEAQAYTVDLFNKNQHTFICGHPYQLSVKEKLLNPDQVREEMCKPTFNEISFMMESGCLFWGEAENAFFKFEDLNKSRRIKTAIYPREVYTQLPNKIVTYKEKQSGEIRLLSADIAVMSSKRNKNDATAIFIVQLLPTSDNQYIRNVLYSEVYEGGHTEDQAMIIRRLYEQLDCDYIVIDTAGVGNGVFDNLVKDMTDDITGAYYPAFTCINDPTMAEHYKGQSSSPQKVIYSIKANSKWNSQCAYSLRDCIRRGKMRLLISEEEFDEMMENSKAYDKLSVDDKLTIKMPYIQTSLMINELVNLDYTTVGNEIKIKETGTNRKDRYSSLSYANQIANELERKLMKPRISESSLCLQMRVPECMKFSRNR